MPHSTTPLLAQIIVGQLPKTLRVPEVPDPPIASAQVTFRVGNPTTNNVWFRFTSRPVFFKVSPGNVSLAPGEGQTITVELDPKALKAARARPLQLVASWSIIEKDPTGRASTQNGEHLIDIAVPPPRRTLPCPDVKCGGKVQEGDTACGQCGMRLQWCPECRTPAPLTVSTCYGTGKHALRRDPDWPMPGGNAARTSAVKGLIDPHASLAWKHAPASPKAGVTIEWSSPAVAWGMVFLAGSVAGEWSRLVALDLATGAELWQVPLPENDPVYPYRGGPAAANGTVYVATHAGYIVAVDANRGRRRWAGRVPHQHFAGCLPAGTGLFVGTAHPNDPGGHLIALWPEDGSSVWSTELGARVDTPIAARDGRVYVCCDDGNVCAVGAANGEILWQHLTGSEFEAGPVFQDGLLYCGTAAGELLCLDAATGEAKWHAALPAAIEAAPALWEGRVYVGCADGSLYLYSKQGKLVGSAVLGAQMRSSPIPCGNGALVGAEDGTLHFSDAIRSAVPLYPTEPGTRISAPLAVSGRRVVMSATNGTVYAVDVAEG